MTSNSKVQSSVTLFGSAPWGFSLSGGKDSNLPLVITKVTAGSIGDKGDLKAGDVIVAANGHFVSDMTQKECEAEVEKAVGSLYLILVKNAASVVIQPSGEISIEGDRSIYNGVNELEERLSRHNRSAKPFPGSPLKSTNTKPAMTQADTEQKTPGKPAGFRSVSFRPKESTKSPTTENLPPVSRGQPDGR